MKPKIKEKSNRLIRHYRIRKSVVGNIDRPRLCVAPTINHIEAQIIDDLDRKTLFGLSTKSKDFQKSAGLKTTGNVKAADAFGKYFAEMAKSKGLNKVVFDRAGYLYHGRVKAFADAARAGGLSF